MQQIEIYEFVSQLIKLTEQMLITAECVCIDSIALRGKQFSLDFSVKIMTWMFVKTGDLRGTEAFLINQK